MNIRFDKQKPVISPWITVVVIVTTLILAVYMLLPEASKREGVRLGQSAQQMPTRQSVARSAMMPVPAPEESSREVPIRTTKSVAVIEQAQSTSPYIKPLPPFGADAVGAPGAWDGERQDGSNSAPESYFSEHYKDYFGNPCHMEPSKMSVPTLRALIPPTSENSDECGYRSALLYSGNVKPSELLLFGGLLHAVTTEAVSNFLRSGWAIADFEELVRQGQALGAIGGLNVYLILKEANSPMAAKMFSLSPESFDQSLLKEYIITGKCPEGKVTDKYCLYR